jgi:hypothetical protein
MSTYLVMSPPGMTDPAASMDGAERILFIPDRFSWLAFGLSPFYLLWNRMWLPFVAYLALTTSLEVAALQLNAAAPTVAAFTVSLLLGFEAGSLRRWSLERKGWRMVGLACGTDREEAELRFFRGLEAPEANTPPAPAAGMRPAGIVPRVGTEQVVGLTLGQETRR